ncbi:MAG: threonine/serine exporter family protein, partial [Ruthenibacterium sp.]
ALISLVCTQICRVAGLPFALNMDKIIIGGIIPLVPGMALTTAIRDFAGGDYLSGTIRLIDALLVASAIAIGVGAVLVTAGRLPGVVL